MHDVNDDVTCRSLAVFWHCYLNFPTIKPEAQ